VLSAERNMFRLTEDQYFLNMILKFPTSSASKEELINFCFKIGENIDGNNAVLYGRISIWKEKYYLSMGDILFSTVSGTKVNKTSILKNLNARGMNIW